MQLLVMLKNIPSILEKYENKKETVYYLLLDQQVCQNSFFQLNISVLSIYS